MLTTPGVLRDLRARTRVSLILPESHLLRERPRFCPSAPSLPDASVSPVAGPRDINVSSLPLWKISRVDTVGHIVHGTQPVILGL